MAPRVSICVPTFNGARWIGEALRSALDQRGVDLEVVVVDDGSSDDTLARARAIDDPRLRVIQSSRRRGLPGNWNACLAEARGELIKLLFQDDLLLPGCLARMTALLDEPLADGRHLGLVFCRRQLIDAAGLPHPGPVPPSLREPHRGFSRLRRINRGGELYQQLLAGWFHANWIGEPTAVLARRECFALVGAFNERLRQAADLEMWARILCRFDAGFIDEPLCAFRVHSSSATAENAAGLRHWLDGLWLAEGLLESPHVPDSRRLRALRYLGLARAAWRRGTCLRRETLTATVLCSQARDLLAIARYFIYRAEGSSGDSR